MKKGKGHSLVEMNLLKPYGIGFPDAIIGEMTGGLGKDLHIDTPLKASVDTGKKDEKAAVTIVVTVDGIGSLRPVKSPLERPPDAGTVEEYVTIPVVGSVVGGTKFAPVAHLLPP